MLILIAARKLNNFKWYLPSFYILSGVTFVVTFGVTFIINTNGG